MKVWVVVGVYSGCIDEVKGFSDESDADKELKRLRRSYGIQKGQEAESEHAAELHELDVS
jgi:hypothetical protein